MLEYSKACLQTSRSPRLEFTVILTSSETGTCTWAYSMNETEGFTNFVRNLERNTIDG